MKKYLKYKGVTLKPNTLGIPTILSDKKVQKDSRKNLRKYSLSKLIIDIIYTRIIQENAKYIC